MNEFQTTSFYEFGINLLQSVKQMRVEDFTPEHSDFLLEMMALNMTNFGSDWENCDGQRQKIFSNTLLDELQKAVNYDTTTATITQAQLQEAFVATARRLKA